jgi:guanylate kinase
MRTPLLLVIGPSGSGKSTAVRRLALAGLLRLHPTWTTRPRRPDEDLGSLEHRFVDDASFDALRDAGFFLDTVELFGLPHRYGLPPLVRSTDGGGVDTVMLRAPLVGRFRAVIREAAVVVQIEDDPVRLEARLRQRGGTPAELAARLDDNAREVVAGCRVADVVLRNDGSVDDLAAALADVAAGLGRVAAA